MSLPGSARLGGDQFRDADKVIGDEVHQEPCTNAGNAAVLGLAQSAIVAVAALWFVERSLDIRILPIY